MLRVFWGFVFAAMLTYVLASIFSTQIILANVAALGLDVELAVRLHATLHDVIGMASTYLPLVSVAFVLGFPVAAWLAKAAPQYRVVLYAAAGFAALVSLHVIMKQVLGVSGVASTRTLVGLSFHGLAGLCGGLTFQWFISSGSKT